MDIDERNNLIITEINNRLSKLIGSIRHTIDVRNGKAVLSIHYFNILKSVVCGHAIVMMEGNNIHVGIWDHHIRDRLSGTYDSAFVDNLAHQEYNIAVSDPDCFGFLERVITQNDLYPRTLEKVFQQKHFNKNQL